MLTPWASSRTLTPRAASPTSSPSTTTEKARNYRWSMGFWYGTPGVFITSHEETAPYVYIAGDYHNAYSRNSNPDGGGSCSELTRDILYVRPILFRLRPGNDHQEHLPETAAVARPGSAGCRGQHVGRYLGREQAFRGYLFAVHNLDLLAGRRRRRHHGLPYRDDQREHRRFPCAT